MGKIGSLPLGSIIKLYHNGTYRDFIVVHQGKPDEIYDDSCLGTWVLMRDIYMNHTWYYDKQYNNYAVSNFHSYLNSEYSSKFDEIAAKAIKQVKIPYRPGSGTGTNIMTGANGLSCKAFLLSAREVGVPTQQYLPGDGAKLDYFTAGDNTKRLGYLNGAASAWWLRSPYLSGPENAWVINIAGAISWSNCKSIMGLRPAMVLASDLSIDDNGNVFWNEAPPAPQSITVQERIISGKPVSISWGASIDPNGDSVGYELEHSVNSAAYSNIYTGAAQSYTENAGMDWNTVQYRVRAVDSFGATNGYVTSPARTVIHNAEPTISGQDSDLGGITEPPSYSYQIGDADAEDTLTITEQIDGTVLRTIPNAQRGTSYTFAVNRMQFLQLPGGQHRMSITVTDSFGNSTIRSLTFTRVVSSIDCDYGPLPVDTMPTQVLVTLRYDAPAEAVSVRVCNNAYDGNPTWESAHPGQKHPFSNTAKTAEKWGVLVRVKITPTEDSPQVKCRALSVAVK